MRSRYDCCGRPVRMNGAAAGELPATIAAGVRIGFGCRVVICRLAGTVCGGSYRCGDGCRCRIEHGLTVVGRVAAMAMAVTCRSIVIGLLEELDEVRRIGECTLVSDLRDRLVGRDQQQPCTFGSFSSCAAMSSKMCAKTICSKLSFALSALAIILLFMQLSSCETIR